MTRHPLRARLRTRALPSIFRAAAAVLVAACSVSGFADEADRYFSANALYNRKLYDLAAAEYRAFLNEHPNHEKARRAKFGLALCLYSAGNAKDAEPLFREVADDGAAPDRNEARLMRAHALAALDRHDEALPQFEDAVRHAGGDASLRIRALAGLTDALQRAGKWDEAGKRADELVAAAPDDTPFDLHGRIAGGIAAYQRGEFDAALRTFEDVLRRNPPPERAAETRLLLGECRRAMNDLDGAAREYEHVVRAAGDRADEATYRLAFVRLQQGRADEAIRHAEELVKSFPESEFAEAARHVAGRGWIDKDQPDKADPLLRPAATRGESPSPDAALWLAESLVMRERLDEAAGILRAAAPRVSEAPERARLLEQLGAILQKQEKSAEAGDAFAQAFDAAPEAERADARLYLAAAARLAANQPQQALEAADRHISTFPESDRAAAAHVARGRALIALNRNDEAAAAFRTVIEKHTDADPEAAVARVRLAALEFGAEKWKQVAEHLDPIRNRPPADGDPPDLAEAALLSGLAAARLENWSRAIEDLERFLKAAEPESPNRAAAKFTLATAAAAAGDKDRAIREFEALAREMPDSPLIPRALADSGQLRFEKNDFGGAKRNFEQLARDHPDAPETPRAQYQLGVIALNENDVRRAAGHFGTAADRAPSPDLGAPARLQEAEAFLKADDRNAAQAAFEKFLADHSKAAGADRALLQLAAIHEAASQWDDAARRLDQLVREHPDSPLLDRALYRLAWTDRRRDDPDKAADRYRELLEKRPESDLAPRAAIELSVIENTAGNHDAALRALDGFAARAEDPALKFTAAFERGRARLAMEEPLEAAKAFEAAWQAAPGDHPLAPAAACQAGEARLALKEFPSAAENFRKASAFPQADDEILSRSLLRLGECEALAGKWETSESAYREFLSKFPKSQYARQAEFGIGWAQENRGDRSGAIAQYEKAAAGDARDELAARARFQIGECHLAAGDTDRAIREFTAVHVNFGRNIWSARALLETGRALEKKGALEEAAHHYREVTENYPDTETAEAAAELLAAIDSDSKS